MEVRRRKKILEFIALRDAKARKLFPASLDDVEQAEWKTPSNIKQRHRTADFLPGNRVVFNLGDNDYRIVVVIDYTRQVVLIRWVGYHKDYDKINSATV